MGEFVVAYNDGNVNIEIQHLDLTQEDCLRIYVWLLTVCGLEIEIEFDDINLIEDEENGLENEREAN